MKTRGEVYTEMSSSFAFQNDMDLSDEQYPEDSENLVDSYLLT